MYDAEARDVQAQADETLAVFGGMAAIWRQACTDRLNAAVATAQELHDNNAALASRLAELGLQTVQASLSPDLPRRLERQAAVSAEAFQAWLGWAQRSAAAFGR